MAKWRVCYPLLLETGESHGRRSLVGYSPQGRRVGHDWATSLHYLRGITLTSAGWIVSFEEVPLVSNEIASGIDPPCRTGEEWMKVGCKKKKSSSWGQIGKLNRWNWRGFGPGAWERRPRPWRWQSPLGVLGVGDRAPDHVLQKHFQDPAGLIHEPRDALHPATTVQAAESRLVMPWMLSQNLAVVLSAAFPQAFAAFAASQRRFPRSKSTATKRLVVSSCPQKIDDVRLALLIRRFAT